MPSLPTYADVCAARDRIRSFVHTTPVLTSSTLDERVGAKLFFKCENFQRAGSFKARGAHNAVFSLADQDAQRGVVAHSSGNHGAAVALAARSRGIPAHLVMPRDAAKAKQEAVARYGGAIVHCDSTLKSREDTAAEVARNTGAYFVHPSNDPAVIAGQGTVALELFEQIPILDAVIAPVSGGGLLAGIALVAKAQVKPVTVLGAEPSGADDAARSLKAGSIQPLGRPVTIADGLRSTLGDRTWPIIQSNVGDILTVPDESTIAAMHLLRDIMKLVVEPSSAVPLAALLGQLPSRLKSARIGVILSGGNSDRSDAVAG